MASHTSEPTIDASKLGADQTQGNCLECGAEIHIALTGEHFWIYHNDQYEYGAIELQPNEGAD